VFSTEQPLRGTAEVNADLTITYVPEINYCNFDKAIEFRYELCTDGAECVTAKVFVKVNCDKILVHTGFSPNNDGVNDFFTIEGLEEFPDHELSIFNARGVELFRGRDYQGTWDGTTRGGKDLPDGTYFYVLQDGEGKTLSGYVQIMR